jgi:NADH-quinone oxidoreductase subunit E
VELDGTTEDGLFTLKEVMCLAACDRAPMLQVNLKYEENLDEARFDALIARLREEAAAGQPAGYGVEALKEAVRGAR